ncbi:hypothetical protein N7455_002928 [Penicillium solitum]|uniref:uncharacterized protein n=1 Tax=Penicillium solitum TaxID=60172 RepID=UPI0018141AC0|nr:hypothetical protein HAV15_007107 [Penicillium sp. str. \
MGNSNSDPNMKLSKSVKSDNDRPIEPSSSKMQSRQTPPAYEESTQNMMKKYAKQVEHAETPEDLLGSLLSDMSIDEKRKLIQDAPDIVFIDDEDKTTRTLNLEARLENANCDELAQRVVYRYHLLNASGNRDWCKELIKLDITLRWIVQRRIWLEQKAKALHTHQRQYMSLWDLSKFEACEKQIQSLNSSYWESHREQWAKLDGIWSMSANRAIKRQRKHADWYLSGLLREDCANRGGCCGRRCGCCERPRMTVNIDGVRDRGHCTTACSCCLEAHNIDGENLEMKDVDEVHFTSRTRHAGRLLKGYVFYLNGME